MLSSRFKNICSLPLSFPYHTGVISVQSGESALATGNFNCCLIVRNRVTKNLLSLFLCLFLSVFLSLYTDSHYSFPSHFLFLISLSHVSLFLIISFSLSFSLSLFAFFSLTHTRIRFLFLSFTNTLFSLVRPNHGLRSDTLTRQPMKGLDSVHWSFAQCFNTMGNIIIQRENFRLDQKYINLRKV